MADMPEKPDASAEKAYAAASAAAARAEPAVEAVKAAEQKTAADAPVGKSAKKKVSGKASAAEKPAVVAEVAKAKLAASPRKPPRPASKKAGRKAEVEIKAAKRAARVRALAAPKVSRTIVNTPANETTITELKEKIMATAKNTDFSKPIAEAMGELQTRAKVAYDKGTEAVSEATDFAKGNVEALVESGKILAGGVQDLGKTYVEEAKGAYETLTADLKELAAVKSPTELFQLQGKIARRNFDALVATGAKNSEAVMKLANDAFAPLSGRISVAAEKISKAA